MSAKVRRPRRETVTGWLLVLPSLLLFGVFFVVPVLHSMVLGFFRWDLIGEPEYVGLGNYEWLLADDVFWEVVVNTLKYSTATVVLTLLLGLGLAILCNRQGRFYTLIQGCIFTSYIVSWVGVSLLWVWLLDGQYGLFNYLLGPLGIDNIDWLGDPDVALWALVGVTVWKTLGYDMIIYLAGLQAIPDDLYEAAALDGAGPWQRFCHVTLPQLAPTTLFLVITSTIFTFQGFDVVRIMTQGGPVHATSIYVFWVWEQAFRYFHVGRASAAVTVFFVAIMVVTVLQFRLYRSGREGTA
jgi:sn-glycerol 3-phosphate transport system permease protein